jgi:hypothetical protein
MFQIFYKKYVVGGGVPNKKIGGGFLGYVLADACGYLSRGRGVYL